MSDAPERAEERAPRWIAAGLLIILVVIVGVAELIGGWIAVAALAGILLLAHD